MEFSLSNIESRLKEWIEKNTDRFAGKDLLNDLAHSIILTMKDHLLATHNGVFLAPSQYLVRLNPDDPIIQPTAADLVTRMLHTLRQVALENEITFSHEPTIKMDFDINVKLNEFVVDVLEKQDLDNTARTVLEIPPVLEKHAKENRSKYGLKINDEGFFPLDQLATNIGRHPENQLVIPDSRVSRHHAQLRMTENRIVLSDLNSTGGTFVNGEQITQQELKPGDIISLAGFPLIFMETIETGNNL